MRQTKTNKTSSSSFLSTPKRRIECDAMNGSLNNRSTTLTVSATFFFYFNLICCCWVFFLKLVSRWFLGYANLNVQVE